MSRDGRKESRESRRAKRRLLLSEADFEAAFRRDHPVIWLVTLVGPLVITLAILAALWIVKGGGYVQRLLGSAVATFFFFGKFVILGGREGGPAAVQDFLTPFQLTLMVVYMDLLVASLLVFHAGFLFKLPFLGKRLVELVEDGSWILRSNPWMKRATFVGLVAFVMFPLAATGSVGGAIFGRLLGMSRPAAFFGIALGSVLGCGVMYYGAALVNRYLDRNDPVLQASGLAVAVTLIVLLNFRYRQMKARRGTDQVGAERNARDDETPDE